MNRIEVRLYAGLNDFLPHRRQATLALSLDAHASVKHVIESLGVPHTEVDLILVDGEPVDFAHRVRDGDRVAAYPRFETLDVAGTSRVRPHPPSEPRFVLDAHLGKLATYLRMLGFDALYRNDSADAALAQISAAEGRILLTRDLGLLKRGIVTHGYLVRKSDPERQLAEVLGRFELFGAVEPFRRCIRCNTPLESVRKEDVLDRLQPKTRRYYDEFARCPACDRIFWKGSHYERMQDFVDRLLGASDRSP
ncbi:MAG: Mut7-C ubiquitin/RNAse domain-containing protein [Chloroflexota bacterium]|nr:Mut7-C ubiquitin/RNAse domain-containing protein [Chloroflexota bacterium]